MHLIFERGDHDTPAGHALVYFRAEDNGVLATYVSVPPIPFNLGDFMPAAFAGMFGEMDLGNTMVATPIPPIPQDVESHEWLQMLAARRNDDLVFAGGVSRNSPTMMVQAQEAAQAYGELYGQAAPVEEQTTRKVPQVDVSRYAHLGERELLNELTVLTGRLRDSIRNNAPDADIEREMRALAQLLPAKYRAIDLVEAAILPDDRGQRLAQLYLERSYKLYNEDYLDLERIDREIQATGE